MGQNSSENQYSIQGYVKDKNNDPIKGANINISSTKHTFDVQSGKDGKYFQAGLTPGVYIIEINTGSYLEHHQIVLSNKNLEKNFIIDESKNALDEVLLKFTSVKSEIEKKGFAVNVIETEDASLRNIQTNELLNRTVGIKVRQNGGLGSSVDYNINGLSGNAVRIFIDGIPISTYGSSFDLNSLSPALIERIEVYKGVVPGHLSDDALGGAINVVLKKDTNNHLNASLSYGSFNTTQANFNGIYNAENSNFFFKASGFYNYSDNDYEVWGKFVRNILPNGRYDYVRAKRFNDAFESYGAVTELGFTDLKWADKISIGYNRSDLYNEIQHGAFMSIPYKGRFTEAAANVFNLNYTKTDIVKGLDANLTGIYSQRERVINDTVRWNYNWYGERSLDMDGDPILRPNGAQQGQPTIETIDRDIYTFRGGLKYEVLEGQNILFNHMYTDIDRTQDDIMRSGLERNFMERRYLTKNISSFTYEGSFFDEKLKPTVFTKFYQQRIKKIDPVVERQNGSDVIVFDEFSRSISETGYGGAISYLLSPAIVILGSAEKAIRLPSEGETFGAPGENVVGNSDLNPERSDNFNLGFKLGPYKYLKHQISISANGFLRDTKDKLVRQTQTNLNDAVQTAPFENLGRTESIGFDAELNYMFDNNLNVLVNVSKFDTRFANRLDSNGNVLSIYDIQIPNEPFFTANANVRYSLKNIFQKNSLMNFYYNLSFVDSFYNIWVPRERRGIEEFEVPQQYVQDAGVSYAFPNIKLVASLDVKNIFDRQAYDNFAVQKPGRSFFLKLNYTITNF
ncbi:TonB-dependent receptor [Zunongwangia atlantica]|uniref:Outer membrane receptor protein n=1 Tax=Zunongwangia atlantica 22II14-10F7 TaxID=1185767 RepID=A0A1Y1T8F3_9FLAO|nr:TonB-dependent receptor [Zunongwangia atlantica]ORL47341.1 outer membrane receptor protein [Zunongwangia atlantica 22II14-10F7]